jgi:hypothetical protein
MATEINKEALELIDNFIMLNHQHAIDSKEDYGMSYSYHIKCALLVAEIQKRNDLLIELNNILKKE